MHVTLLLHSSMPAVFFPTAMANSSRNHAAAWNPTQWAASYAQASVVGGPNNTPGGGAPGSTHARPDQNTKLHFSFTLAYLCLLGIQ